MGALAGCGSVGRVTVAAHLVVLARTEGLNGRRVRGLVVSVSRIDDAIEGSWVTSGVAMGAGIAEGATAERDPTWGDVCLRLHLVGLCVRTCIRAGRSSSTASRSELSRAWTAVARMLASVLNSARVGALKKAVVPASSPRISRALVLLEVNVSEASTTIAAMATTGGWPFVLVFTT